MSLKTNTVWGCKLKIVWDFLKYSFLINKLLKHIETHSHLERVKGKESVEPPAGFVVSLKQCNSISNPPGKGRKYSVLLKARVEAI